MHIRSARDEDIPAIGRVHVDAWRTTYVGIVSDEFLANLSYEKQAERQRRYLAEPGAIFLVAEVPGSGIVGFLTGGRERSGDPQYPGELYAIYLLKEHRRQGIGIALVCQWAAAMRAIGINSALVWATDGWRVVSELISRTRKRASDGGPIRRLIFFRRIGPPSLARPAN